MDTPEHPAFLFRESFMKRFVTLAVAVLAVTACQDASGPASRSHLVAPLTADAVRGVPIPGDYIVTLRDNVSDVTKSRGLYPDCTKAL